MRLRAALLLPLLLLLLSFLGTADAVCTLAGWYDTPTAAAASLTLGTAEGAAITDGPFNYPSDQDCFKAYRGCTSVVFTSFDTEGPHWDWLSLYDGPTESSTMLINQASGNTIPAEKTPVLQAGLCCSSSTRTPISKRPGSTASASTAGR